MQTYGAASWSRRCSRCERWAARGYFGGLCSRKWANGLKNELADWLKNNLPKLSTPSLYAWYGSFKKQAGLGAAGSLATLGDGGPITSPGALDSVELDDLKERYKML